jgi:ATP-binding cassette subfamily B protein
MKEENWIKIVFSFAKNCKGKIMGSVLCAFISVAGSMIPYFGAYQIIRSFFEGTQTIDMVVYWSMISVLGHLIKIGFYGISTTLSHVSAYTILEQMRLEITKRLMKAPLGTVLNEQIGQLKSVIVDRVETIELPLAHMIPEGLSNLMIPIAVFIYLISINWKMAIAATINILIAVVVYKISMKGFGVKYQDYMVASSHVNSVMVEYVEGIEVVKAFNQASASYDKFENAVTSFRDYTLEWFRSTWKALNLGGAILPTSLLGTLPIGLYLYCIGELAPVDYMMCIILSMGIIGPLTSFVQFVNDGKAIEFAVRDANHYLKIKELKDSKDNVSLKNNKISIEDVSFGYDEKVLILEDVNLEFKEAQFTAIVGPSGSGKSTIAKLIARFWDVTKGKVMIGEQDIKKIPLKQLAEMISFVAQDNFLFDCSLKENIRLGNCDASDEEVRQAAKAACCDEFIEKLEAGYDTEAGVAGDKLSGGEKQRIAIARAILKNAPIIILDEATAFTDPENEDKIQKSIKVLTKNKTLIVIAHRLSTIKNADKIILLNDGKVLAQGTQEELLERSEFYQTMWKAHIGTKNRGIKGGLSQ